MHDALKAEIFEMINSIDDENLLLLLKEDIAYYMPGNNAVDDLTKEQEKELDEAIAEADRGEVISWDDLKKEMESWKKR